MKKKLKVLTLILMIALIICSAKMAFAATPITSISTSSGNSATNNTANNNMSSYGATNNAGSSGTSVNMNNPTYNNVASNTNTATNLYSNNTSAVTNTTMPETGAKPKTVLIGLIVLALISSVYTYAKVKKYNI